LQAAAICRQRLNGKGLCVVGTHQELSRAVLDGAQGPMAGIAARKYDAVILGWGSLSHVLEANERTRIIRAAAVLSPQGPVLASFFLKSGDVFSPASSRAWRVGQTLGQLLDCNRRSSASHDDLFFGSWCGFAVHIDATELEHLAKKDLRRELIWEGDHGVYPHITLLPRRDDSSE